MLKLLSTVLVAVLLVGWGEFSPAATAAEKGIAEPAASSTKEISDTAKNKSKFEVENDEDEYDGLPKAKGGMRFNTIVVFAIHWPL